MNIRTYQIIYFLIGVASSLVQDYFFMVGSGHAAAVGISDNALTIIFALVSGIIFALAGAYHYKEKERRKANRQRIELKNQSNSSL